MNKNVFVLLCDGRKEDSNNVVNRCCPNECIGGPREKRTYTGK